MVRVSVETKSIEDPCTDDCIRIVWTILHQYAHSIWGQPQSKGRFSAYEGSGVFEERTEAREGRFVSEPAECSGGSSPNFRGVGSDPWQEGFGGWRACSVCQMASRGLVASVACAESRVPRSRSIENLKSRVSRLVRLACPRWIESHWRPKLRLQTAEAPKSVWEVGSTYRMTPCVSLWWSWPVRLERTCPTRPFVGRARSL